jgi:cell wall-associated NlpC family hydrolase
VTEPTEPVRDDEPRMADPPFPNGPREEVSEPRQEAEPPSTSTALDRRRKALNQRQEALMRDAHTALGIRYRWGGASRGGFDCSGFTRYMIARNLGIKLPHSAHAQAHYGQKVALGDLREGDLVFFRTYRRGISHVGIYVGSNQFIHAPRTGRSVAVESLAGYYRRRYVTARRLAAVGPPG